MVFSQYKFKALFKTFNLSESGDRPVTEPEKYISRCCCYSPAEKKNHIKFES